MSQNPDPEAPSELASDEPAPPVEPSPVEEPFEEPFAPAPPAPASFAPASLEPLVAPEPRRWRRRLRPEMRARDLAIFMRGALLLALTGLCVAAFALQLTGAIRARSLWDLHDFVSHNMVPRRARIQMLAWLGAGGAAGGLVALALYRWRARQHGATHRAGRVLRTGRVFWPLMLPTLAWSLVAATGWDPMSRVSGIACVAVLTELSVRRAAGEVLGGRLAFARRLARAGAAASRAFARTRARLVVPPETAVVLLATAFYAVWMSWSTILQHRHFGTGAFDLGNYDTMFFNVLHGRPFRCPSVFPKGPTWSMLGTHVELTMFALLPLYALRPGAETLLVLQAIALAIGAIPLYRFAARRLPRTPALVLALAYLLYAPMHQANFYDFHLLPFAVAFTLWAVDMLDAQRPVLFALFFALALGCREDVAIGFVVLGTYLLLRGKRTRAAIMMAVVAAAYYAVIKLVVMPHFNMPPFAPHFVGSGSDVYKAPTGENTYGGAVETLLANPLFAWKTLINFPKLALFLLVLAPVAFLPLRRRLLWMSLVPAVPITVLTPGYGPTLQLSFQDVLMYVPFFFLASALALAAFHGAPNGRARLAGALGGIAMATFLTTRVWGAMPPGDQCGRGFRDIPELRPVSALEKQKSRDLAELAAKIPRDASVAVTEMEHPHVSTRLDCLDLRNGYEGADYILYAEDGGGADGARRALASGAYEVVERRPASIVALLRKKNR